MKARDLNKYQGIFPAFYACYDDAGEVSPARARAFTEYLIEKGVNGLYVGGSSGECIYHSVAERKALLEAVIAQAAGRVTIIAHVACNNTRDSMELAAHAESAGADCIAAIPPIYFHLPDRAIAQYWTDIASAAPNTDFIIYNIPQLAGTALNSALLRTMLAVPTVIGVKNSSMPVQDIQVFKALGGEDSIVFNGPDEQFVGGRLMGADGGIGGTYGVMPELFLKMEEYIRAGEAEKATPIQYAVDEIISALCAGYGSMYAIIKEVLKKREGIDIGGVRKPQAGVIPEDQAVIDHAAELIDKAMENFIR